MQSCERLMPGRVERVCLARNAWPAQAMVASIVIDMLRITRTWPIHPRAYLWVAFGIVAGSWARMRADRADRDQPCRLGIALRVRASQMHMSRTSTVEGGMRDGGGMLIWFSTLTEPATDDRP